MVMVRGVMVIVAVMEWLSVVVVMVVMVMVMVMVIAFSCKESTGQGQQV